MELIHSKPNFPPLVQDLRAALLRLVFQLIELVLPAVDPHDEDGREGCENEGENSVHNVKSAA